MDCWSERLQHLHKLRVEKDKTIIAQELPNSPSVTANETKELGAQTWLPYQHHNTVKPKEVVL